MSNQSASAASSHVLKFTVSTGINAAGQTIVLTFPSDFNFTSKNISTVSFTHGASTGTENTETLSASPSVTAWGAAFSSTNNLVLTLTAPTGGVGAAVLAPHDKVIITYNATHSFNPSVSGSYVIAINANSDTGNITVPIIDNNQVAVSADIDQTLSFSVSNSSIGFGILDPAANHFATADTTGAAIEPTAAHTISISTNAASGYSVALSGDTLTSGINTITAIPGSVAQPLTPGTEQFGIRAAVASGTGTVSAPFNGSAGSYGFGSSSLNSQPFCNASGSPATAVYNVNYAANITSATETGSYITTLTYVATSNF